MERSTSGSSGSGQVSPVAAPPPTIFVQAEPHTFRDLVQKHTGAPAGDAPDKLPVTAPPPGRSAVAPRRAAFKLQDRRPSVRKLEIKLGLTSLHQHQQAQPSPRSPQPPSTPGQQYLLIPAAGGPKAAASSFPSPVTPLGAGPLFSPLAASEEERAIAEKGFYLHPSPRGTPRGSDPPELLPLFPLTSPKLASRPCSGDDDAERKQL
ncbi:hypothetical protein Taro_007204 [Colocasia esculenta]|uniref:VQ domain-containing protein n=1 Tax=Colocasia esculenta TaxID=4460 RepID=A0A843TZR9_COLES|nr:hypothetical protein [Colocasia esculenta]